VRVVLVKALWRYGGSVSFTGVHINHRNAVVIEAGALFLAYCVASDKVRTLFSSLYDSQI
jgi:hypothetical protein